MNQIPALAILLLAAACTEKDSSDDDTGRHGLPDDAGSGTVTDDTATDDPCPYEGTVNIVQERTDLNLGDDGRQWVALVEGTGTICEFECPHYDAYISYEQDLGSTIRQHCTTWRYPPVDLEDVDISSSITAISLCISELEGNLNTTCHLVASGGVDTYIDVSVP